VPLLCDAQIVEDNVSRSKVGNNGDVLGVRPYRRGDSPRRIHWAQSARHDRLIVCELQANGRPAIQIVFDDEPAVHSGDGPDSSREWAIRIVASLVKGWLEAGAQVAAVWNQQAFPAESGQRHLQRLLDSLASLDSAPGPALCEQLAGQACRTFRDGFQAVVTTDKSMAKNGRLRFNSADYHWAILSSAAFGGTGEQSPESAAIRAWLWIDSRERIPALLRNGWKEAQHGS
jgi:uncharacterized protein (DUF58 family)